MSSPSDRFAAAKRRARHPHLQDFLMGQPFQLDDFQVTACEAVEDGKGALVAAPTGAGKTVVGEFAVHLALATGRKCFYTTPIKALSNQKYHDLAQEYGEANVGLLTGDSSVNGNAPVVVMTTEVLRNMLYSDSSTLAGLGFVVMDEVHYLADRMRGVVWEEVILHLPDDVQVISLSATVSNAEEFGAWLKQVRGDTEVVVSEVRPVPLWQHMMVGNDLYDLFPEGGVGARRGSASAVNPELMARLRTAQAERTAWHREDSGGPAGRRGRGRRGSGRARDDHRDHGGPSRGGPPTRGTGTPSRTQVVQALHADGLLPAIVFIFSRIGCDSAVRQLLASGTRLISDEEGEAIHDEVEARVLQVAPEDLGVLGYHDFVEGLTNGYAAHHAGMLPLFREIVEELFAAGRIQCVFATETLALGVNMPARTTVIEKLVKFNGENHADLTPAEYTQLTGRAGRRGIDVEGHAVVLSGPRVDPTHVAGLASTRTFPLKSSFRPSPNMAVNLVERMGRQSARELLEESFAQFQADRAMAGHSRAVDRNTEAIEGYREAMECHLGDFSEYADLRQQLAQAEKDAAKRRGAAQRAQVELVLGELVPGDVVRIGTGRRAGRAVVITGTHGVSRKHEDVALVTDAGRLRTVVATDLDEPPVVQGRVQVPSRFNPRKPKDRKDLAATMRAKVPDADPPPGRGRGTAHDDAGTAAPAEDRAHRGLDRIDELRAALKRHPCHACPDREEHARWAARLHTLERETAGLQRKVARRTHTVSRAFDRTCSLLAEWGYLTEDGQEVTEAGRILQRTYTEKDLLVAECLQRGTWQGLDAAELAAIVSVIIHEPRRGEVTINPTMPTERVDRAYEGVIDLWSRIEDSEIEHQLPPTAQPDAGMAWMMHKWASGARLEMVLRDSELSAGDFVRRAKQVVDLLGQVELAAPHASVQGTARKAMNQVLRGVVAADRLD
ncbi:DEAD/DEAH box helicase [Kytococcus sedentarius]|uniref:Superfamily II RNA helicase n=1 Tax=Kytococcus sedentarius (strain ATCC 14392 / DSM 20547 / JCM 11482 / CCUG 33030 / NBRC 15357 / NCTC 11040 / CCM 314 / 541) TaxID=478801 RepID=C7NHS3_KYTSD|nr:DEAD/DEAH box helicase [Kytococcus sedentarius]ACV06430.1 superfamily II RNA helicase [Kytococcus sedentarius DSM 20547]QQB64751.1 DEAD/DEAH box helicase [Kytococcus sedentarius]STX12148.1 ski2-like helicase [Kytococcus sedentarius]